MTDRIIVAGFGGQGVISIGKFITEAGMDNGKEVSFLPAYGSEMRGGTANCNVIISDEPVDSPQILEPNILIALNIAALNRFLPALEKGGKLIVNSSLIDDDFPHEDYETYFLPANTIASENNAERSMNMLFVGAYAGITGSYTLDIVDQLIERTFTGTKSRFNEANKRMAKVGYEYFSKVDTQ